MEIGSFFLIFALLLLVGLYVGRPIIENQKSIARTSAAEQNEHERSALLAERDRLITALRELDFDHLLGKIPEEDYPSQRTSLMHKGAEVLRRLDEYQTFHNDASIDDQLEAVIAARRLRSAQFLQNGSGNGKSLPGLISGAVVASPDDDVEIMLANRRRVRHGKSAGFCPNCGRPIQKSDHFCPKCGAKTA